MRFWRTVSKINKKYFDKSLDLRIQVFNLLIITFIFSGAAVALASMLLRRSLSSTLINLMVAALSFVLLLFAEKKKRYRLCSLLFVILAFFILFPVLFFQFGGYKSGTLSLFLVACIFTSLLLEKHERSISLIFELNIYILCFFLEYYRPDLAVILSSEFEYTFMTFLNFIFAGAVLLTTISMRSRLYNTKQDQEQELIRELAARAETLAQYDRMKSDFLSTVAHEINTPLAIIAASSNDTLDLLDEPSPNIGEIKENQKVIYRRVKMIDSILLDLMDAVSIESGRLSLNRKPVFLADLMRSVCSVLHKKLDNNDNSLTFDLQGNLPRIWVDPARIEQVMTNLLTNAFAHSKNGLVEIGLIQKDGRQIAHVSDNGEGMDPEVMRTALMQYVSTKADYWRHGIGLYLCRRIVLAHGGEIWIDSEKGRGTTISFSLREESAYV